jgi:hypothetical protein
MHIDWLSSQEETPLGIALSNAFTFNTWVKANIHSNIRLANGKNMNIGEALAFGRKFSTAKYIVREAFRSSQRQAQASGAQGCQAPFLWINFYPEKECLAPV